MKHFHLFARLINKKSSHTFLSGFVHISVYSPSYISVSMLTYAMKRPALGLPDIYVFLPAYSARSLPQSKAIVNTGMRSIDLFNKQMHFQSRGLQLANKRYAVCCLSI